MATTCETFMVGKDPVLVTLREELTDEERAAVQEFLEWRCWQGWAGAVKEPAKR